MKSFPLELAAWITALILLAFTNPQQHHFSLCPLENLSISWCPGCGLGRSVSCILRGKFSASLSYHWFGFPAVAILCFRIFILSKNTVILSTQNHNDER